MIFLRVDISESCLVHYCACVLLLEYYTDHVFLMLCMFVSVNPLTRDRKHGFLTRDERRLRLGE